MERVRKQRLQPYDKLLKSFNYGAALDAALATGQAQVVACVLQELSVRDGVRLALLRGSRDDSGQEIPRLARGHLELWSHSLCPCLRLPALRRSQYQ